MNPHANNIHGLLLGFETNNEEMLAAALKGFGAIDLLPSVKGMSERLRNRLVACSGREPLRRDEEDRTQDAGQDAHFLHGGHS